MVLDHVLHLVAILPGSRFDDCPTFIAEENRQGLPSPTDEDDEEVEEPICNRSIKILLISSFICSIFDLFLAIIILLTILVVANQTVVSLNRTTSEGAQCNPFDNWENNVQEASVSIKCRRDWTSICNAIYTQRKAAKPDLYESVLSQTEEKEEKTEK